MKKIYSIILLLFALFSCEEESTVDPTDICLGLVPNQTNVLQALEGFVYDGTCLANKSEAQNMLRYICPDGSIHYPDENTVCGEFEGGYHLTLWIGTYGETDKYGLRYGKGDDHSFWGDNSTYFEITKTCFDFCNVVIPNGSNVLEALENYAFDGTSTANHTEAENILKHLCSSVSIHYPDENTVCGEFATGYHLTLWVNTYSNTDRYGARYGTEDNHSFWGSNDTYFEIVKPYSLSLNGTWLATEYIDKDGRDMLNGFSFTQQQTLCNGSCVLDLTWDCKYEDFQVVFNEENVTMNYYIKLDYPAYNCSPCTAIPPDGTWDSSDLDTRSASCSVGDDYLTLTGFILAYGGELFNPTIVEFTEDFIHLQEGAAILKLGKQYN